MKLLIRVVAAVIFVVFFGFALKNTQEAVLSFFLGYELRGPLVILLLGFFATGAVFGVLAMMPTVFRHRRDVTRYKKQLGVMEQEQANQALLRARAPSADGLTL
ncbi:MAG: LapA family protein [Pseudomonadota bacterium]